MAKKKRTVVELDTIWECPDDLWNLITPVLAELDPPHVGHRPRTDPRKALDGMIFRLRSGCQWNHLPRHFGDDSAIHRTLQRWIKRGVLDRIWALVIQRCSELDGVDWSWQSVDCSMGKARFGGTISAPTRPTGRKMAVNAAF